MTTPLVREATLQDIPQLYKLMVHYIVDFYNQPKPDENDLQELIKSLIENPSIGKQFVAEHNDEITGFATLYFTFSTLKVKRTAILNDLFVTSKNRGQKIGENLFNTCLTYIRENDFTSMAWETAKDNEIAQSLYHKMGGQQSEWLHYEIK